MTQVGINWAQYLEGRRHNLVSEALMTKETNIKQGTLDESIRHNKALEDLNQQDVVTRQRAQNLNERIYQTVTLPESVRRRELMQSERILNEQRTRTEAAHAGLYNAQTISEQSRNKLLQTQELAEQAKRDNYKADTERKQKESAKLGVEVRVLEETAEGRIEAQNFSNYLASNPITGTIKDAFATIGSLVHVQSKTY